MKPSTSDILLTDNFTFQPEEPLGENLLKKEGHGIIRVWQPKTAALVLGRSQNPEKEINLDNAVADNIPIFKRHGGGGAVLLNPQCVCVAIKYKREKHLNISHYMAHSSEAISCFLEDSYNIQPETKCNNDLTLENKKFLGCSLYMPKDSSLYLAVILIGNTLDKINRYLKMPSKQPAHRQNRSHEDFLIPLSNYHVDQPAEFAKKLEAYLHEGEWASFVEGEI